MIIVIFHNLGTLAENSRNRQASGGKSLSIKDNLRFGRGKQGKEATSLKELIEIAKSL